MVYRTEIDESAVRGIVEDVADATSPLVTGDMFRAHMYRALWLQGAGIGGIIGIIGITEVIG